MATEDEWGDIIRISPMIHIPDNVTDTSPFCLAVQANGADAFKLALCLISDSLEGMDARIVNTLPDEILIEARDGIEDQVQSIVKESMEEAFKRIIPEVPFVAKIRVADSWG
jgi:DNA polymerase I-like protein with 3'-5' exonuclease and polymerase domains